MDGLKGDEQNLGIDAVFAREPMKLLLDRSYVINSGGSGDDVSSRVLDQVQFMEGLEREPKERGFTVINAECEQVVNMNGGAFGGTGRGD